MNILTLLCVYIIHYILLEDLTKEASNLFSINIIGFSDPYEIGVIKTPDTKKISVFFLVWYFPKQHNITGQSKYDTLNFISDSVFLILFTEDSLIGVKNNKISLIYLLQNKGISFFNRFDHKIFFLQNAGILSAIPFKSHLVPRQVTSSFMI